MAGRFAPAPDVRANTRWRPPFSEHRIAASGHGASRHRHMRALTCHAIIPPCNFLVRIRNRNDGSPCFEGHIVVLQEKVRTRSAQNGSLPSSVDPRLPVPEATLFRNVRKLRSPISIPRTFNTSTQAQFATCTIHVLLMFVSCSRRSQSISSHGTLCSGVSNAHLCRKLAWGDWIILEAIASGLAVNAIVTGMRGKERG